MAERFQVGPFLRGLLGGAVGGIAGYYAFGWILGQGLYAMILPGAAIGWGFSLASRDRSTVYGIVCAIAGIGLGLYAEWRWFPFIVDGSFEYFIKHVHDLQPISLIMIALGGVFAYWFGIGRTPAAGRPGR